MFAAPDLEGKFALKGGTAIHSIFLGFERLSVDIDLNYVGNLGKELMLTDRIKIEDMLHRIFRELGYLSDSPRRSHSEEQFYLSYTNAGGNRDRLKVEINYSERLPVLPITIQPLGHPFDDLGDVRFPSYQFEEHMAIKTRALLTRTSPRDLFDIFLCTQSLTPFDLTLYRKLAIFYLCLAPIDVRKLSTGPVLFLGEKDIKRNLVPLLRRKSRWIDLQNIKMASLKLVESVLSFDEAERRFLDVFYDERIFNTELLFGNIPVAKNLAEHPVVRWRLGVSRSKE